MKIRRPQRSLTAASKVKPGSKKAKVKSPEQLVLVYSANNVSSLGRESKPVAGSFRLLPQLKELSEKTKGTDVTVVFQGYEKLETGQWETRRYRIEGGELKNETKEIDGFKNLYDNDSPPKLVGASPHKGAEVSMFSPEAVQDFLLDAMKPYPGAKHTTLFLNAHGAPTPHFGGEAIINKQWQRIRQEDITVKSFGEVLESVEKQTGNRLDLLDLNTCEMGKVENYLELGEHADFMLASPQNEFVPKGHEYTAAFQDIVGAIEHLLENGQTSPRTLGETIIDLTTQKTTFAEKGVVENPIPTLELLDTSKLSEVGKSLDKAGRAMSKMLKTPESRKKVLTALQSSFSFRESVLDLEGFLKRVDSAETKELVGKMDEAVLVSYAGKFRGRDYSEAGPIAFFAPQFPNDKTPPVLVPQKGDDIGPLIDKVAQAEVPESRLRMWVVRQSGRLNDLQDNIVSRYPAMLEVAPNEKLQNALRQVENPESLLDLSRELQTHMSFSTPEKLAPIQDQIKTLLTPVEEALREVDLEQWLEDFEASGGEEQLSENAKQKALTKIRKRVLKPVRDYQDLANLPQGWKQFMEDLANTVVDDIWANSLTFRQ